jgi:nicotinamidase/pyrazinamidase
MRTLFLDVDTQIDFLYPAGALYVPGAERIVCALATLNRHAAANGIPLVSATDAHLEDDPEFASWPPHCVAGTAGQAKPAVTLLDRRIAVPHQATSIHLGGAQQAVVEKRSTEVLLSGTVEKAIQAFGGERIVVYGVVTEICVASAALGLLRTGRSVSVVTDAVAELNGEAARNFLAEFQAAGGTLTTVAALTAK